MILRDIKPDIFLKRGERGLLQRVVVSVDNDEAAAPALLMAAPARGMAAVIRATAIR